MLNQRQPRAEVEAKAEPSYRPPMLTRRSLLKTLSASTLIACGAPVPMEQITPTWRIRAEEALANGARWLWSQQSEHGHWRSTLYGPLRSGQSLTPFALLALTRVPDSVLPFPAEQASKSLGWLKNVRSKDGAIGVASSAADYPVYASSLTLAAAWRMKPQRVEVFADPIKRWLLGEQFTVGWEDHPAHGGFGMGGGQRPEPPNAGHVDLSMTRRAIEGLVAAGVAPQSTALQASRDFVLRCRRRSGAFVYSPVDDALNKGVRIEQGGSSEGYGTATCDALLALNTLGVPREDPAITEGLAWLKANHDVDKNPGIGRAHASFGPAMVYGYRASSARVFTALGGPDDWDVNAAEALRAEQRDDGSWVNEFILQKEDEAVIATAFALTALTAVLGVR